MNLSRPRTLPPPLAAPATAPARPGQAGRAPRPGAGGRRALLVSALLLNVTAASAASLQVFVLGSDGRPAPDTAVLVLPAAGPMAATPAAQPAVIVQKDLRFMPYLTVVPPGSLVRFVNRDSFDHHVRSVAGGPLGSVPPVKDFEFRLAAARGGVESSAELKFESPGAVALGCHIHGSMRGHVLIAPAPYQAVTDAAGRVLFPDIPNASAEIRLWHPDQLVEQPVRRVNLGGRVEQELTLNFAPRRRPTPRP
jgi:plastocyanin